MKLKVTDVLKGYKGEPLKNKDETDFAVRDAVFIALNNTETNAQGLPEKLSSDDKMKCYKLTREVMDKAEVNWKNDDRKFIQDRGAKFWSNLVYGQMDEILNK